MFGKSSHTLLLELFLQVYFRGVWQHPLKFKMHILFDLTINFQEFYLKKYLYKYINDTYTYMLRYGNILYNM